MTLSQAHARASSPRGAALYQNWARSAENDCPPSTDHLRVNTFHRLKRNALKKSNPSGTGRRRNWKLILRLLRAEPRWCGWLVRQTGCLRMCSRGSAHCWRRLGEITVGFIRRQLGTSSRIFAVAFLCATKVVSSVCTITQSPLQPRQWVCVFLERASKITFRAESTCTKSASAQLPSLSAFRWRASAGHAPRSSQSKSPSATSTLCACSMTP